MGAITPAHLILILIVALLVIGPGKLPETGAALGKAIRQFRDAAGGLSDEATATASAASTAAPTPAPAAAMPAAAMPAQQAPAPTATQTTIADATAQPTDFPTA